MPGRPYQNAAASESDTRGSTSGIETRDDDDIGDDPDLGIRSEPHASSTASELEVIDAAAGDWFTYRVCVLLKDGPTLARKAFCLSQPRTDVRARCFSRLNNSPVEWANWCYNEFVE